MARRAAKELLHVQEWLGRVDEITRRGKHAYFQDPLMQEAGGLAHDETRRSGQPAVETGHPRPAGRRLVTRGCGWCVGITAPLISDVWSTGGARRTARRTSGCLRARHV